MPWRSLVGLFFLLISRRAADWKEFRGMSAEMLSAERISDIFLLRRDFSRPIGRTSEAVAGRGER